MRFRSLLSILFILTLNSICSAQDDDVRIGILIKTEKCRLKVRGYYQIQLPYTQEELFKGKNLNAEVRAVGDGLQIGDKKFRVFGVEIVAKKDGYIYLNGRPYRGKVRFINEGGKLTVVNVISIEDYLKGVLNYEVAHWWPMQALMAQAVASRSYALYMKKVNRDKNYDLTANIYSQVYGGRWGERWKVKRAIKKTQGLVLFYNGEILPAFYHSTCGGHTDSADHVWKIDIPPLKGVPCNFCQFSPHYRWEKKIKLHEIRDKFVRAGYSINEIQNIAVKERYETGFVKSIEIKADHKVYTISAKEFRHIIGVNILRSRRFLLKTKGDYLYITGYGWGHGIGMCQWGAYGMALRGYNFKQILNYYYPGAEIKKIRWEN